MRLDYATVVRNPHHLILAQELFPHMKLIGNIKLNMGNNI